MPRFSIRRLMLAVCGAAGLLAIYRAGGKELLWLMLAFMMLVTGTIIFVLPDRPRLPAWSFGISACFANIAYFFGCVQLELSGMFMASFLVVPFVLGSGSVWAMTRPTDRRPSRPLALAFVLVLGLSPLVMLFTIWPFRVAFALSRPSLDRLADRVAAGEPVAFPTRAGFYEVEAAIRGTFPGDVALVLESRGDQVGFVRTLGPPGRFWPVKNLYFDIPIDGPWRFQVED